MVAHLTGSDPGPRSYLAYGMWDKKIISTNKMNIQFDSVDFIQHKGFSAKIYFTQIPNKECESWLDMKKKIFKSPNYPQPYHNSKKCSWLMTVDHDYHITLNFIELYVRYQITQCTVIIITSLNLLEIYFKKIFLNTTDRS